MKIVFPMQLGGSNAPVELASLDAFIEQLNALNSGTFPIGRNRLWHGGIHLSEAAGWHTSGAVRAIADGEIVAYRLAKQPAKATLEPEPEQGQPGEPVDLYTSPSFCLVRHRYEAGEQSKNRCTFYSLYMHIACENSYSDPQAAKLVVKGHNISTYEPVLEQVNPQQFRVKPRTAQQGNQTQPVYAIEGAEVKLATPNADPSTYLNQQDESHPYHLVSYINDPGHLFYIAASQLEPVFPQKPAWMTPPEGKPLRYGVRNNSWLRQSASTTEGSLGLPAGSEVVASTQTQMVTLTGGPTEFRKVSVFKPGSGSVQDSAGHNMAIASKGAIGWLASNRLGDTLAAEPSTPVTFAENAPVVDRSANPIAVQAGEVIGHWGEHQAATANPSTASNAEPKAVHVEVFVAHKDKQALEDCLNNKAQLTGGQRYLRLEENVTTYRLISNSRHDYHDVAKFGPLALPLAVNESDILSHGSNQFVKVRERAAATGELAGEYVLLSGDTQLISQHDWAKLGVKLIDGSKDEDGFLDKADTAAPDNAPDQQEASEFFNTLYQQLVTDRDSDGTLSGNDIKAALADAELAGKLRRLFIKHESEWIKREEWPRLEQELTDTPNLYKYAMQVHKNMAWIDDAKVIEILGDTKPWFIHPAGMMGLVGGKKTGFIFTLDVMKRIYINFQGNNSKDHELQGIADELNEHIELYQLDTPLKRTHFFAQILQETGPSLHTSEGENWSIDALKGFAGGRNRRYPDGRLYADVHGYEVKDRRTGLYLKADGSQVTQLDKIEAFNTIYGNRPRDLGNGDYNTNDGWNFRGRGLKQVTGRYNYTTFNEWHSENQAMWPSDILDVVSNPDLLSEIKYATRSAAWFWIEQGATKCFELASAASDDAVNKITDIVNYHTDSRANRVANFWRLWNEKALYES